MLLKIPCPITGEEIKNPVIYDGYIYDVESLKMHYPQLQELINNALIRDLFTQDLLNYIQTTRSTKIKLSDLNEIYQCPFLYAFPFNSVLCLKDGRVYDTEQMNTYLKLYSISPFNHAVITKNDFIKHPFHAEIVSAIFRAAYRKQEFVDISNALNHFQQTEVEAEYFVDKKIPPLQELLSNYLWSLASIHFLNIPHYLSSSIHRRGIGMYLSLASTFISTTKIYKSSIDEQSNLVKKIIVSTTKNQSLYSFSNMKWILASLSIFMHLCLDYRCKHNVRGEATQYLFNSLYLSHNSIVGLVFFITLEFFSTFCAFAVQMMCMYMLFNPSQLLKSNSKLISALLPIKNNAINKNSSTEKLITLFLLTTVIPLAILGHFKDLSLCDDNLKNSSFIYIFFLTTLPFLLITTLKAIDQFRIGLFHNQDTWRQRLMTLVQLTVVIAGLYPALRLFAGRTHAMASTLNTVTAMSFDKCFNDFEKVTFFKKLPFKAANAEATPKDSAVHRLLRRAKNLF